MDLRERAKALVCLAQMYPFDAPQVPRAACETNMREAMAAALTWAADISHNVSNPEGLFRAEAARLREAK